MYAHALTYPSLRAPRSRRLPVRRPRVFVRRSTRHVRVIRRQRAAQGSWPREIVRVTAALANVAAWATLLFLVL